MLVRVVLAVTLSIRQFYVLTGTHKSMIFWYCCPQVLLIFIDRMVLLSLYFLVCKRGRGVLILANTLILTDLLLPA